MRIFQSCLLLLLSPLLLAEDSVHIKSDVKFACKQTRPGYVFQITCNLNPEIPYKRIPQNYYFLLDRSSSISRPRFFYNKKAIYSAISMLQPEDSFNIISFGGPKSSLSCKNLTWNKENILLARSFLETLTHGGPFASTDLYASLDKILPKEFPEDEINTALLLSDGDTYLSQTKQREIIGNWSKHNKGKVTLFALASGNGNNLPLLELLSSFNKGALLYAPKHEQIVERTVELIRSIQNPVGKDLTIEAIVSGDKKIMLQPKEGRLPHLYKNRPVTIYGSTSALVDFTLKLKGRIYGQLFAIEVPISLKEAGSGSYSIERKWMQLAVQDLYENYFEDGNQKHLELAKQLLAPLNLPIPFLE